MHFNELPDVVLAQIIDWTYADDGSFMFNLYTPTIWKTKLALLAVCRKWRALGFLSAHRISFIASTHTTRRTSENNHTNVYSSYPEGSDYTSSSDELVETSEESCTVRSNLDIIDNRSIHLVKELNVYISAPYNLIYSLNELLNKLQYHGHLLKLVRKLELTLILEPDHTEPSNVSEASLLAQKMSQLFPSVQSIKLVGSKDAPVAAEFAKSIIKCYSHQLTRLEYPQEALGGVNSFSDNLKHVEIGGHRCPSGYLPQICAENLVELNMEYIHRSFDWSSFGDRDNLGILHFDSLKRLQIKPELEEDMVDNETGEYGLSACKFNYQIIAPKLENVILSTCPFTLSLLSSIKGIESIKHVALEMRGTYLYFTNLNLNISRELFSSYAKVSQDEIQIANVYAYVNDICGVPNLAEYTKAKVGFSYEHFDIEQINWRYLMDMELYASLNVRDLKKLLLKLPNLENVYIDDLQMEDNGQLSTEAADEMPNVESIPSKIRAFSFASSFDYTYEKMDKLMMYVDNLIPGCISKFYDQAYWE